MKACTRPSHSFCLSDIVKFMGRSSLVLKIFGLHSLPAIRAPQGLWTARRAMTEA
jgi:hypothetical protein